MGANKFCVTRKVLSVFHIIVNALSLCLLLFIDKCLCHYCMLLCKCNFKQLQSEVKTLHIKRYSWRQTCSPLFLLVMFLALVRKMLTTSDTGVLCFHWGVQHNVRMDLGAVVVIRRAVFFAEHTARLLVEE